MRTIGPSLDARGPDDFPNPDLEFDPQLWLDRKDLFALVYRELGTAN